MPSFWDENLKRQIFNQFEERWAGEKKENRMTFTYVSIKWHLLPFCATISSKDSTFIIDYRLYFFKIFF